MLGYAEEWGKYVQHVLAFCVELSGLFFSLQCARRRAGRLLVAWFECGNLDGLRGGCALSKEVVSTLAVACERVSSTTASMTTSKYMSWWWHRRWRLPLFAVTATPGGGVVAYWRLRSQIK